MSKLLQEEDAEGKVKEIYGELKEKMGMVPDFFKAQGAVDPDWLETNWNRCKVIMDRQGSLDRKTKELLALTVAYERNCEYCVATHTMAAKMVGASDREIEEAYMVRELFDSFTSIADSLDVSVPGKDS